MEGGRKEMEGDRSECSECIDDPQRVNIDELLRSA